MLGFLLFLIMLTYNLACLTVERVLRDFLLRRNRVAQIPEYIIDQYDDL